MDLLQIISFAKKNGYDDVIYLGPWNGYDAYEPIFNDSDTHYIGVPLIILVNGNTIRMSTVEEALEHLDELLALN